MPRSGSTMLCDLLGQTNVAGRPNSFFRDKSMDDFAEEWGVPAQNLSSFDAAYLNTALDHGTAGTGCFGLRAMWNNMPPLIARLAEHFPGYHSDVDVLEAAFGPMQFIHLSRSDKVAEAVSLAIATQTGLWHRHADGQEMERIAPPAAPRYDADLIATEYAEVTQGDKDWRDWFAAQNITPHALSYEALAANPAQELAKMLDFLGLDPKRATEVTPGTAKLATPLNQEWAAQFRIDAGIAPGQEQV